MDAPSELRHTVRAPGRAPQTEQPQCVGPHDAERLAIPRGGAATSATGTVVGHSGESWSHYDDGTFEVTAQLAFKEPGGATETAVVDLLLAANCGVALGRLWRMTTARDGHAVVELARSSRCPHPAMKLDEVRRRADAFARAWLAHGDACEWRTFDDFRVTARALSEAATGCYGFIVAYDEIERCRESFDAGDSPLEVRTAAFARCEAERRRARARCGLRQATPLPIPLPGLDVVIRADGELRERPRR